MSHCVSVNGLVSSLSNFATECCAACRLGATAAAGQVRLVACESCRQSFVMVEGKVVLGTAKWLAACMSRSCGLNRKQLVNSLY